MNPLIELNDLLKFENTSKFITKCIEYNLDHLGYLIARKANTKNNAASFSDQGKLEFMAKNKYTTFKVFEEMVKKFSFLSHSELLNVYKNFEICGTNNYSYYNPIIVRNICERTRNYNTKYTFSITTCKRLDLFTSTMNSFLNCCQDLHLIDRWICVDDNSSSVDREKMKELYPFFEFIFKNETQKGHVNSMNLIQDYVKLHNSKYLFHIEDDFLFFISMPFISLCTTVLESNDSLGQCLLNRNYAETCEQWSIHGGKDHILPNGIRYVSHEYYDDSVDSSEKKAFYDYCKTNNKGSCAYWPHFSFRPSLIRTSIFETIGKFNNVSHFEMEYAHRYTKTKFESAFLYLICCKHIGKLTHEKDKDNAYSLNNEQQFSRYDITSNIKKYVVFNMEKRPDRLQTFKENNDFIIGSKYNVVYAFDGYKLSESYAINRTFDYNNHNWRKTILGCAVSHLKIWYELKELKDDDIYVVFEDDIVIVSNFNERIKELSTLLKDNPSWDIVFLGYAIRKVTSRFCDEKEPLKLIKCNTKQSFDLSFGGTYGYMINGRGARKLLSLYNVTGIDQGIDTMMQKACDLLNVYYIHPHLVSTVHFASDSDIQKYNFVSNDFLLPSITSYISTIEDDMKKNKLTLTIIPFDKTKKLQDHLDSSKDVTIVYNSEELPQDKNVIFYFMHNKGCCLFTNPKHELIQYYKNRLPMKFIDYF